MLAVLGAMALTSLLLELALPPSGRWVFGWVALVPLIVATRLGSGALAFAAGVGSSLLAARLALWGLFIPRGLADGDPGWVWMAYAVFGVLLGTVLALSATAQTQDRSAWLRLACFAVLLEWATLAYLPAHLALTQFRCQPTVWLAAVIGVWGVSGLVWAANFWIADQLMTGNRPRALAWLGGAVASIGVLQLGMSRLPLAEPLIRVRLIQTDDIRAAVDSIRRDPLVSFSVWPELAANGLASDERLALSHARGPFISSYEASGPGRPTNRASLFAGGEEAGLYDKRCLFAGESFIHTAGRLPVSTNAMVKSFAHDAGERQAVSRALRLGLNICFDSCCPSILRETVRQAGAVAIALPTLDPHTPHGIVQAIHAAYTPFRSAELGVPIIRCDATGYSMITDARGRIVSELGLGEAVSEPAAPMSSQFAPVRYLGDWFPWASLAGFIALTARESRRRYQATMESALKRLSPGD